MLLKLDNKHKSYNNYLYNLLLIKIKEIKNKNYLIKILLLIYEFFFLFK